MGRFKFNLSDHTTREEHVTKVRLAAAAREDAEAALTETFDPEASKASDNPFPEPIPTEAPVEETAAAEETVAPVRKCSVCGEPGHTKRTCPTLAASEAEQAGVSELDGGRDDTTETEQA